jgi:hypothetical protein
MEQKRKKTPETLPCPNCKTLMKRVPKKPIDKLMMMISFNSIDIKRFYCGSCLKSFPVVQKAKARSTDTLPGDSDESA